MQETITKKRILNLKARKKKPTMMMMIYPRCSQKVKLLWRMTKSEFFVSFYSAGVDA